MRKASVIILLLAFIYTGARAQQKKDSIKFSGSISVARLTGESQKLFTYQAIGGITYKKWFAGLGAAYDRYGYKSIPVFVDVKKYFGNKKNWQPLVYGDAGVNLGLYSEQLPRKQSDVDNVKFSPGFYGEAGAGIARRISKKIKLCFSAGFSFKQFSYLKYNLGTRQGTGMQRDYSMSYDYNYRRYSLKLGLQF